MTFNIFLAISRSRQLKDMHTLMTTSLRKVLIRQVIISLRINETFPILHAFAKRPKHVWFVKPLGGTGYPPPGAAEQKTRKDLWRPSLLLRLRSGLRRESRKPIADMSGHCPDISTNIKPNAVRTDTDTPL